MRGDDHRYSLPDVTAVYTHDVADRPESLLARRPGRPPLATDARGITVARTLDVLDRVTAVTYPDSSLNILYTYDDPAVPFSRSRLTRIARPDAAVDCPERLAQALNGEQPIGTKILPT